MSTNQMGLVSKSKLIAIANAIRTKLGVSTQYSLDDMPTAIANISGGGGGGITPAGTIQITENGTFDVTQYASAAVNVPSSGGGASWVTVAEQTLAEDAAEIVLSDISGTYDVYEIALVGQTSAVEWIYPIFTSGGSQGKYYISASGSGGLSTFNTTLLIAKSVCGDSPRYCIPLRSGNSLTITQRTSALDYLKLVLYNSGSKFKSGFTVTIRGMNYPN